MIDLPDHLPPRIAVFLPIDAAYGREILRGVARYYRDFPAIQVLKFNQTSDYDPATLRALEVGGIIAKVTSRRDERALLSLHLPVLNFSGQFHTSRIPTITSDDSRIGRMAARHFTQRGFQNFAFCGSNAHQASHARFLAFRDTAREHVPGHEVATLFVPDADQDAPFPTHVREEIRAWIASLPQPCAVFTFTDRLGLEVDEACRQAALEVPRQIAILGVGNDLIRIEFAHVPLSSIELPTESNGFRAAEILEHWRRGGPPPPLRTLVRPRRLITRASTDHLAVPDEAVAVALGYIHEHLGNPIRVTEIAKAAGVSRRTLEGRFQTHLHQTVYGVVQNLKFERALQLLGQPEVSIGDIAARLGFSETKIFSRAFRERFGHSPRAFRTRL